MWLIDTISAHAIQFFQQISTERIFWFTTKIKWQIFLINFGDFIIFPHLHITNTFILWHKIEFSYIVSNEIQLDSTKKGEKVLETRQENHWVRWKTVRFFQLHKQQQWKVIASLTLTTHSNRMYKLHKQKPSSIRVCVLYCTLYIEYMHAI